VGVRFALPAGLLAAASASVLLALTGPDGAFDEANAKARAGDYPKAIAAYQSVAAAGGESASLYWNWAQSAAARGTPGEALWALLRAREIEPGDRAVSREIDRLRQAVNLDAAELAPDPLAGTARLVRLYRIDLGAAALLVLSVLLHAAARLRADDSLRTAAVVVFILGGLAGAAPLAAAFARPSAVVVKRGAPLLDSASPSAEIAGSLREGEVVPVLAQSGGYLRIEDSSGARGWAAWEDVRRLDRAPSPAAP
jgi:hypothetical protein